MHRVTILGLIVLLTRICFAQQGSPRLEAEPVDNGADKLATRPVLVHAAAAEYPEQASIRKLNGECTVSALIDTKGVPREIKVVKCSNPLFISNSYAAVNLDRFKPAQAADGTPVATRITINFHFGQFEGSQPRARIRYSFRTPPGTTNAAADANGVYPLTQQITLPVMSDFVDDGLGIAGFGVPEGSACDVTLIVAADGKPADARATYCEDAEIEKPMVASLRASRFKPGRLNGRSVAVRVSIHLVYAGPADPHQH